MPEEYGGANLDYVTLALVLEEIAAGDGGTSTAISVTNCPVNAILMKYGTAAQKKHWLTKLARGEMLGAFCLTETHVGSDASLPVIVAQILRKSLMRKGQVAFDTVMEKIGPWSIAALLLTLVLLFAFQGEAILKQPLIIGLLAVPILIQVFFNSALAYWLNRVVGEKHNIACPSALIGASNFFELAVAAAISLFGFNSGAALATVVGVLIEVPVMLLVVYIVNNSKGWYERGSASQ